MNQVEPKKLPLEGVRVKLLLFRALSILFEKIITDHFDSIPKIKKEIREIIENSFVSPSEKEDLLKYFESETEDCERVMTYITFFTQISASLMRRVSESIEQECQLELDS
jgi:hypothetical protein